MSAQDVEAAESRAAQAVARTRAAEARLEAAAAGLNFANASLENTLVRAPFSGTVLRKEAEVGEVVAPSVGGGLTRGAVVTMADLTTLEVEVDVNEAYIARIGSDQPARITLDAYPDTGFRGAVRQVVPTADRQKATVLVRIGFNELDPRILPDMGVKVTFLRDSDDNGAPAARPVSLVPRAVLRQEGDRTFAFVVGPDNVVERRAVTTGGTDGDRVEVLAGLNGGERVVVAPPPELADGAVVIVN